MSIKSQIFLGHKVLLTVSDINAKPCTNELSTRRKVALFTDIFKLNTLFRRTTGLHCTDMDELSISSKYSDFYNFDVFYVDPVIDFGSLSIWQDNMRTSRRQFEVPLITCLQCDRFSSPQSLTFPRIFGLTSMFSCEAVNVDIFGAPSLDLDLLFGDSGEPEDDCLYLGMLFEGHHEEVVQIPSEKPSEVELQNLCLKQLYTLEKSVDVFTEDSLGLSLLFKSNANSNANSEREADFGLKTLYALEKSVDVFVEDRIANRPCETNDVLKNLFTDESRAGDLKEANELFSSSEKPFGLKLLFKCQNDCDIFDEGSNLSYGTNDILKNLFTDESAARDLKEANELFSSSEKPFGLKLLFTYENDCDIFEEDSMNLHLLFANANEFERESKASSICLDETSKPVVNRYMSDSNALNKNTELEGYFGLRMLFKNKPDEAKNDCLGNLYLRTLFHNGDESKSESHESCLYLESLFSEGETELDLELTAESFKILKSTNNNNNKVSKSVFALVYCQSLRFFVNTSN